MKFFFNRKAHNVFKAIGDVREALGAQQYIATDEIATVMFLAERLENKLGFFALVRQLKPHVFLVAFRCAPTAHCSRSDLLEHLLQRWRQMLSLSDG